MEHPASIRTTAAQAQARLNVVKHLADVAEEIRYDLPSGYRVARSGDGVRRPVEANVIAREERQVLQSMDRARLELARASDELARAATSLDAAINRWESTQNAS